MNTELLVSFTIFPNVKPQRKTDRADIPWREVVARIKAPNEYPEKGACPLISMCEYGPTIAEGQECLRYGENVQRVWGIEVDYDGGVVPIEEGARRLREANLMAVLYTTARHRPEAPRWRAILPLSEAALPEQRAMYAARANRALGGIATRESFTLSQSFYIGHVKGTEYQALETAGRCIDQAGELEPLYPSGGSSSGNGAPRDETTDADLRAAFDRGEDRYQAMLKLSSRWAARGMPVDDIEAALTEMLGANGINADGVDLHTRIRPLAESAVRKFGESRPKIEPPQEPAPKPQEPEKSEEAWIEPLPPVAFQGLLGDIARAVEPNTESDPAALMLQVIVAFGALVGRGPHVRVEGDEHHLNLFALLAGETAKARKGTSWGRVRETFEKRPDWTRVVNGLSSGEGLKYNVRDPLYKMEKNRETGEYEEVLADKGVEDKRLLVVEPEFAQALRQVARAGNTLSATVRAAWDTGNLMTLTKNDPVTATGAHISIIGHITIEELRAELTATDSANGFANRYLFMCVKRSKLLPFGGGAVPEEVRQKLDARIARAVELARTQKAVGMTSAAKQIWQRVYATLSAGRPGLLGAVTARGEAQCLRLALAYALADGAGAIDYYHLEAALALWARAEASAAHIFGSAIGDRVADEILRALRGAPSGMTRTDISYLFKRNVPADRIGAALDLLLRRGMAKGEQRPGHGGRPAEVWFETNSAHS
jgi:hypothetical protein